MIAAPSSYARRKFGDERKGRATVGVAIIAVELGPTVAAGAEDSATSS